MNKPIIALVKGQNRYRNITKALELIKPEIAQKIKDKKRLLIKVNFVTALNPIAATNVESVKAFLDFVKPFYPKRIPIVEKGVIGAGQGFKNNRYLSLPKDYPVTIGDYTPLGFKEIKLLNANLEPKIKIGLSKQAIESDFLVSITPAKTHDYGVVTLGLKNVGVGFLNKPSLVHQGYQAFNLNLYLINQIVKPHLTIIDGTIGMECNGPAYGEAKKAGWVMASLDAIQADVVATKLMGFEPKEVGYLYYFLQEGQATDDFKKIEIRGDQLADCQTEFRPHDSYKRQLNWDLSTDLKENIKLSLMNKFITPLAETSLGKKLNASPIKKVAKKIMGFS